MSTEKLPDHVDKGEQQIRELQRDVDYQVREYPIEVVVQKHLDGLDDGKNELFVPDYQRDLVWDEARQSRFIESLLIGLPIPYVFVADVGNDDEDLAGRLEIVDGTQRIRTLARFLRNDLVLTGLDKLGSLNNFRFTDLTPSRQRRFGRITLRMIELTEQATEEIRRDMFERINTGSMQLNPMETRRGSKPGPFMALVESFAKDVRFTKLAPVSEASRKRFEREELVIRFFAFRQRYQNYGLDESGKVMSDFVDSYATEMNNSIERDVKPGKTEVELHSLWDGMLVFVNAYFPNGFAKNAKATSTPRVRFDAIAVGSSLAISEKPNLIPRDVLQWLNGADFKKLTTSDAANNRSRVLRRIDYVRDRLLA